MIEGRFVVVKTKMGRVKDSGFVKHNNADGVLLESGKHYSNLFYNFFDEELTDVDIKRQKLEQNVEQKKNKKDKAEKDKKTEKDKTTKKSDSDKDGVPDNKDAQDNSDKGMSTSPNVDVNNLPPDIRKSVVSVGKMDTGDLNSVLSEIGDTVVKSLRRVNVKDDNIYVVASKIQKEAKRILSKAPKEEGVDKE